MTARLLGGVIRLYQILISPLLGNVCRFYPSCSEYAVICLRRFGAFRGSLLAVGRLCRCHPFHPGGVDLPPGLSDLRRSRLFGPCDEAGAREPGPSNRGGVRGGASDSEPLPRSGVA